MSRTGGIIRTVFGQRLLGSPSLPRGLCLYLATECVLLQNEEGRGSYEKQSGDFSRHCFGRLSGLVSQDSGHVHLNWCDMCPWH